MKHIRPKNMTRICGKRQGYKGLMLRDRLIDPTDDASDNGMTSLWKPGFMDLMRLIAGGAVRVVIIGETPPPMHVSTIRRDLGHNDD